MAGGGRARWLVGGCQGAYSVERSCIAGPCLALRVTCAVNKSAGHLPPVLPRVGSAPGAGLSAEREEGGDEPTDRGGKD